MKRAWVSAFETSSSCPTQISFCLASSITHGYLSSLLSCRTFSGTLNTCRVFLVIFFLPFGGVFPLVSFSLEEPSPVVFAIGRPSASTMTIRPSEPITGLPSSPSIGRTGTCWAEGDSCLLRSFLFSFIGSSHLETSTDLRASNFITSYFHPLSADDMSLYSEKSPSGSLELSSTSSALGGVGCWRGVADLRGEGGVPLERGSEGSFRMGFFLWKRRDSADFGGMARLYQGHPRELSTALLSSWTKEWIT